MPTRLSKHSRSVVFLLLRLAIFAVVTWWAVHWILLREIEEKDFVTVSAEGIKTTFRSPAFEVQTRDLTIFGQKVFTMTRESMELNSGKRLRNARGRPLLWVKEGDGFYPQARSGAVFRTSGTNYIDYSVLPPDSTEWMFKVEHRISRKFQVGPFKFEAPPRNIIYRSPVMTNSASWANESNGSN